MNLYTIVYQGKVRAREADFPRAALNKAFPIRGWHWEESKDGAAEVHEANGAIHRFDLQDIG